jgi:hypothetical protein
MKTIAKFKCSEVTMYAHGSRVILEPVIGGSDENEKFFQMTPYGKIELGLLNPDVKFTPGKEYFITFEEEV